MRNLYDRLKAQREARATAPPHPAAGTSQAVARPGAAVSANSAVTAVVRGRNPRRVAQKVLPAPPWREIAPHVWQAVLRTPAQTDLLAARSEPGGLLIGPEHRLETFGFFDSETTGLSGGAGTTVFLVAVARLLEPAAGDTVPQGRNGEERPSAGAVETTLLFLSDFSGEPAFLESVSRALARCETLVSYNGRAFDMNILRNRFLLNRMQAPELPHIDLLYPVRRLFSALLDSCSLSTVERTLLNVRRVRDVDGAEIPDRWLAFLDDGDVSRLEDVFAHVHRDVLSLVELLQYIEAVAADPDAGAVDRFARARLLIESPYRRAGNLKLRCEALRGLAEVARAVDHPSGMRAARYYCALQRRNGNRHAAREVWQSLYRQRRSVWAAEELAKDLEHRVGDLEGALGVVLTAAGWSHAAPAADALERRRRRLEAKIARRRSDAFRSC